MLLGSESLYDIYFRTPKLTIPTDDLASLTDIAEEHEIHFHTDAAWDGVETSACGSHLRSSSNGVICDSFERRFTDVDQRICTAVVQAGANLTLEGCEDALHQVVGETEQLFACPVNDQTVPLTRSTRGSMTPVRRQEVTYLTTRRIHINHPGGLCPDVRY